jgi:hypothetical protein
MACKIKIIWFSAIFLRPTRTSERWGCFPMRFYFSLLQENLEKALLMGVKIMSKTWALTHTKKMPRGRLLSES